MNKLSLQTAEFIISNKQLEFDLSMVLYDLWGTTAHVLMLNKQKIIPYEKAKKILLAIKEIEREVKEKKFSIDPFKGAQLTLEAKIVEKAGDAGLSVHTGRSRNDQITVVELLFLREKNLGVALKLVQVCFTLLKLAKQHKQTVMPGYTHMQPAKPTTVGQWALSYLHAFLRAGETLKHHFILYNQNPLGACESYGTSWNLDREYTTELLGFNNVWEMPQDAISSRGFAQYGYLTGLSEISLIASKIAEDLILFNTFEFGMVELGEEVSQRMHPLTGSSVMAQKKNPDALELIRVNAPQIIGLHGIVGNVLTGLFMGYNRDVREIKEYISIGLTKTSDTLSMLEKVLQTAVWDRQRMADLVINNYSLTTDLADYISQKSKVGYRIIYKIVGSVVDKAIEQKKSLQTITAKEIKEKAKTFHITLSLTDSQLQEAIDPHTIVSKRKHIGGSNPQIMNKAIKNSEEKINLVQRWRNKEVQKIIAAKKKTNEIVKEIISNNCTLQ